MLLFWRTALKKRCWSRRCKPWTWSRSMRPSRRRKNMSLLDPKYGSYGEISMWVRTYLSSSICLTVQAGIFGFQAKKPYYIIVDDWYFIRLTFLCHFWFRILLGQLLVCNDSETLMPYTLHPFLLLHFICGFTEIPRLPPRKTSVVQSMEAGIPKDSPSSPQESLLRNLFTPDSVYSQARAFGASVNQHAWHTLSENIPTSIRHLTRGYGSDGSAQGERRKTVEDPAPGWSLHRKRNQGS